MVIKDENYYGAMYYMEVKPGKLETDFGTLGQGGYVVVMYWHENGLKPAGKAAWTMETRFHYFAKDHNKDISNSYRAQIKDRTEAEVDKVLLDTICKMGMKVGTSKVEGVNLRGNGPVAIKAIAKANKSWMAIHTMPESQFQALHPNGTDGD